MQLTVDNYIFDFPEALDAFKFDEANPSSPNYHGVSVMKAVDMVVEFPSEYLYVEIKEYEDLRQLHELGEVFDGNKARIWLRNNLIHKYRDTFLYRWCEKVKQKPIYYICLLNFDAALLSYFRKELASAIPVGEKNPNRWRRPLLAKNNLIVLDESTWNRTLSQWGTCNHV